MINVLTNHNGRDMMISAIDADFLHRRALTIVEEINAVYASVINAALRELARVPDKEITLYINSPGGEVTAALSICDQLDAMKQAGMVVNTIADGMAASAAALLVCAGTKGKRFCSPNATILLHQPWGGVSGQATDIQIAAAHIISVKQKICKIIADSCNRPYEEIGRDLERDFILDAKQAQEYGIVDHIGRNT